MCIRDSAYVEPKSKKPYFKVQIGIADNELEKIGRDSIKTGMPVEAFFATEKRTPINYVTRPLTEYFGKAFRDS